ncbi:hypothetical protein CAEBREN_19509 [Caenorhabditis brenneri]|uniref:Transmembrane protein n=1 Tax=Caenorhabditis brenneri TaxID=135651 RepID=G0N3J0_CAEBE|nr:hypothetical protein CAEBREN_19509 [Caenorhabditis brenneri]
MVYMNTISTTGGGVVFQLQKRQDHPSNHYHDGVDDDDVQKTTKKIEDVYLLKDLLMTLSLSGLFFIFFTERVQKKMTNQYTRPKMVPKPLNPFVFHYSTPTILQVHIHHFTVY